MVTPIFSRRLRSEADSYPIKMHYLHCINSGRSGFPLSYACLPSIRTILRFHEVACGGRAGLFFDTTEGPFKFYSMAISIYDLDDGHRIQRKPPVR